VKKVKRPKKKEAKYVCGVCGFALSVDESSGRVAAAETVCCGKKMGKKKIRRVVWERNRER